MDTNIRLEKMTGTEAELSLLIGAEIELIFLH